MQSMYLMLPQRPHLLQMHTEKAIRNSKNPRVILLKHIFRRYCYFPYIRNANEVPHSVIFHAIDFLEDEV